MLWVGGQYHPREPMDQMTHLYAGSADVVVRIFTPHASLRPLADRAPAPGSEACT